MRLTPNQICSEPGCLQMAEFGCDSWDDAKGDYCDRPVCVAHSFRTGTTWHWCGRHYTPRPVMQLNPPAEAPVLWPDKFPA